MRTVLAALAAVMLCASASGQPVCLPYPHLSAQLARLFGEHRTGRGVLDEGMASEIFLSPSGSWTFVVVRPDGIACVVASGREWRSLADRSLGRES